MQLICRNKILDCARPRIMGIVNVTPDSFSDGGRWNTTQAAVGHALRLIDAGADLVDIGGESTRPGAVPVSVNEELDRVLPVVAALDGVPAVISVDTRHPQVMRAAIAAGADMINDVQALTAPDALESVLGSGVAVCLMHMVGQPDCLQLAPQYEDVVRQVHQHLLRRVEAVSIAGINRRSIVIDPGIGFGKSLTHNLQLLRHLDVLSASGLPVLVGASRKTMLGQLTGRDTTEREFAGIAAHLYALKQGACMIRVHDVAAFRDAVTVWQAIEEAI